jgi:hypothetical protein
MRIRPKERKICLLEKKNCIQNFLGEHIGKIQLGRLICKMGGCYYASSKNNTQDVDWIRLVEDNQQWQALMNRELKLLVPQNGRNFLSS